MKIKNGPKGPFLLAGRGMVDGILNQFGKPKEQPMRTYLKRLTETFATAWREAQLDLEAERELRICAHINSIYVGRAAVDAEMRLSRFLVEKRGWLAAFFYRCGQVALFFNHRAHKREWDEIEKRCGLERMNAMIPHVR